MTKHELLNQNRTKRNNRLALIFSAILASALAYAIFMEATK